MTLGVIGHAPHWIGPDGTPFAYEPYVREMRIWADLFARVRICSPTGEGPLTGNLAPYRRGNIDWHPVPYSLSYGTAGAARRLLRIPGLFVHAWRTVLASDFLLLRSPGHFGFVGALLARWKKKRSITKWAGENGAYPGERIPSRLDRVFQGIPNPLHPVLVYGPARRSHQISFFPALMTSEELSRARVLAAAKTWRAPWKILSVGILEPVKGFDLAIRGLAELLRRRPDIDWEFTLVGDGSLRSELKAMADAAGIGSRVHLTGALPFEQVQTRYAAANIVLMPGVKEGWPKVIAEAWAHGAVPMAARAGLVPWILEDGTAGVVFDPDPEHLAEAVESLLAEPARMQAMAANLFARAAELSLEQFGVRLERVLTETCGLA
jgi:glycosyltransferase involved in cell wall biosynthesis